MKKVLITLFMLALCASMLALGTANTSELHSYSVFATIMLFLLLIAVFALNNYSLRVQQGTGLKRDDLYVGYAYRFLGMMHMPDDKSCIMQLEDTTGCRLIFHMYDDIDKLPSGIQHGDYLEAVESKTGEKILIPREDITEAYRQLHAPA